MPADVAEVFQAIEPCIQHWYLEEMMLDGSVLKSEDGENVGTMTRAFDTYMDCLPMTLNTNVYQMTSALTGG